MVSFCFAASLPAATLSDFKLNEKEVGSKIFLDDTIAEIFQSIAFRNCDNSISSFNNKTGKSSIYTHEQ